MITKEVLNNAFNNLKYYRSKRNREMTLMALGYVEACLGYFGVVDPISENGVGDYMQRIDLFTIFGKTFTRKEDRYEIIVRLTEKFLIESNKI